MTGFGFGSLYGADPGLPYTDPSQTNPMGLSAATPMQSALGDTQALLAQYTPQQLAVAKARGMIGQNGVPLVPPSAFKVNSQGQPYSPDIQAQKVSSPFDPNDPYVNGGGSSPSAPTDTDASTGNPIADYIIQGAKARGINPNEALHVVSTEGGLGAFKIGDKQWKGSGGPFQLNMLPGSLGDQMLKQTGLNPLDPANEKAGIDYALNYVQNHGGHFSPDIWHGLRNNPYNGGTVNIPAGGNDPTAHQYASAGGSDGTMDTSVDTSNMPPLTNLRALAAPAMVDPSTFGSGPQSQVLQGLLQNPNIQRALTGQGNPSATLAKMAAGFLSGNGTHSGLAAGFAGLASGEDEDQKNRLGLLSTMMNNQNSLYKMGLENNMNVNRAVLQGGIDQQNALGKLKLQQAMNAPFRQMMLFGQLNRATPTGDAAVASGLMKPDDPRVATLNASWKSGEPVPAGVSAQSQKLVQQIQDARNVQIQAKTVADWAKSGAFQLDPVHKAMYNLANQANMATDASSKYAAANQATASIATKLRSAFGNRMTDADLAQANAMVTGGTGSFGDNKVMGNHYDGIGNQAYQAELAARKQLQDLYQSRKLTGTLPKDANGNPDFNSLIPDLPASPYANTKVNSVGTNVWGDNTTNPGATASPQTPIGQPPAMAPSAAGPATAGVGMLKTKNGLPVTYIPPSQ